MALGRLRVVLVVRVGFPALKKPELVFTNVSYTPLFSPLQHVRYSPFVRLHP
jgi:hypothetical protein